WTTIPRCRQCGWSGPPRRPARRSPAGSANAGNASRAGCRRNQVPLRRLSGRRNVKTGPAMLTRHSVTILAVLCPVGLSFAQDPETTSSIAPEVRAAAAFPVRQDARQWLGLNLIGAKVVSASGQTVGRIANLI